MNVSINRLAELTGHTWRTVKKRLKEADVAPVDVPGEKTYDAVEALRALLLRADGDPSRFGPAILEAWNPSQPNPLRFLIECFAAGADDAIARFILDWLDGETPNGARHWEQHGISADVARDIAWRLYARVWLAMGTYLRLRYEEDLAVVAGGKLDELATPLLGGAVKSSWSPDVLARWNREILRIAPREVAAQLGDAGERDDKLQIDLV